jgi:hypothetical protein
MGSEQINSAKIAYNPERVCLSGNIAGRKQRDLVF